MKTASAERLLESFMELHTLTKLRRAGWILAGVPESVADHCFEAALFAVLLSKQMDEDIDIGRVVVMLLFHEVAEARITDLPRRSAPYVGKAKKTAESAATLDILHGVGTDLIELLDEMHEKRTPRSCVREGMPRRYVRV